MVPSKRRFITIPSRNGKNNPYIIPEDQIHFIEFVDYPEWDRDGNPNGKITRAVVYLLNKNKEVRLTTDMTVDDAMRVLEMLN